MFVVCSRCRTSDYKVVHNMLGCDMHVGMISRLLFGVAAPIHESQAKLILSCMDVNARTVKEILNNR